MISSSHPKARALEWPPCRRHAVQILKDAPKGLHGFSIWGELRDTSFRNDMYLFNLCIFIYLVLCLYIYI